jgi:hypothetical protein
MYITNLKCLANHISFVSSHSNEPLKLLYFFLQLYFNSINSTKLELDLHLTLTPFGQFLFTKASFSRLCDYKGLLLKLMNMPTRENIFSISIWNPVTPKKFQAKIQQLGTWIDASSTTSKVIWYPSCALNIFGIVTILNS